MLHLCRQFVIEVAGDKFMGEWIFLQYLRVFLPVVVRANPQYGRQFGANL